jgi:hypothetical protein
VELLGLPALRLATWDEPIRAIFVPAINHLLLDRLCRY